MLLLVVNTWTPQKPQATRYYTIRLRFRGWLITCTVQYSTAHTSSRQLALLQRLCGLILYSYILQMIVISGMKVAAVCSISTRTRRWLQHTTALYDMSMSLLLECWGESDERTPAAVAAAAATERWSDGAARGTGCLHAACAAFERSASEFCGRRRNARGPTHTDPHIFTHSLSHTHTHSNTHTHTVRMLMCGGGAAATTCARVTRPTVISARQRLRRHQWGWRHAVDPLHINN